MDPIARPCLLLLLASLIHAMPVCPVWCAEPQSNLNPSSDMAEASARPQVRVEFSSQFGRQGTGPEEFLGPFGVHVSQDGLVYVGDDLAHTIKVFRKDGSFLNTIGGPALFSYLDKVIADAHGRIYVADAGNNKVQVLGPQGKPLREIRKWGLFGGFKNPRYLSFDRSGRLFVADWGSHCIRVFGQNLDFMQTIGRQGAGDGEFENPIAVAHDSSDRLFVSDFKNHRIQLFDDRAAFFSPSALWAVDRGSFGTPRVWPSIPRGAFSWPNTGTTGCRYFRLRSKALAPSAGRARADGVRQAHRPRLWPGRNAVRCRSRKPQGASAASA